MSYKNRRAKSQKANPYHIHRKSGQQEKNVNAEGDGTTDAATDDPAASWVVFRFVCEHVEMEYFEQKCCIFSFSDSCIIHVKINSI